MIGLMQFLIALLNDEHLGDLHGFVLRECVEREILTEHQVGQIRVILTERKERI